MSKHFTHLHLHTEYSLLDGAIRLPDLIKFAKDQEWKAVGISDHGNIFGGVKFFQLAKKEGIKPILGTELYFIPDVSTKNVKEKYYHIIVIVQNWKGYQNLCRLMAFAYQDGFYFKPRIDYATLEKYHEGLIITTACVGGYITSKLLDGNISEAERSISWFKDRFGPDRFFFELAPPTFDKQKIANPMLIDYANKWGLDCIATSDAHYMGRADREAHEVLLAVQTKDVMSNPDRYSFGECEVYVRTTQEMLDAFPQDQQHLMWNTGKLADSCEFMFEFGKLFFPSYPIPQQHTQESYFQVLCQQGFDDLVSTNRVPTDQLERYQARLDEEVRLITQMGFIGYLLIVSDFIRWAKEQGIPVGPGRGSVVGSLVAWCLKITNVDPLKYTLLFERFLNPERVSMPDIDIDFCMDRREEVITHIKDKYGHDCVCQIITFGTMMAKGVLKDVARTLGFPFQDANALTDLIPDQLHITLKQALEQEPRLQQMIDVDPQIKKLFDVSFRLEGLTRHASKHAAGIVISPEPLAQSLPLYSPANTKDLVAQYAMTELEAVGFLKIDLLGLKNLTVIDQTIAAIKKNHGVTIDLDQLPLDDSRVFALFSRGDTDAIFQFEGSGVKEVLRRLMPEKFEDLIAVNALYRPGPLGAGMVDDFIARRHGQQEVTYMFPALEPVLAETYGVIVYQEQVMKIASTIAGYSLGGADILRKAMGKKKADVMEEQRALFVQGAQQQGYDIVKAGELFDQVAYFAGYGFNKAHSTAYALIAYQTAYLKTYYPREFMATSLTFEANNPDELTHYLQEVRRMNIPLLLPDINRSQAAFTAVEEGILFGLQGIKNVGGAGLTSVLLERDKKPFNDLLDFCKRVDLRTANKRVIEHLIAAGAFDKLPGNRAQKTTELDTVIAKAHQYQEQQKTGQMGIFDFGTPTNTGDQEFHAFQPLEDWTTKEKLEKEKEVAGFYLSAHPLTSYPVLRWLEVEQFEQAKKRLDPNSQQDIPVQCVGLLKNYRAITTKKGDRMAFAQVEDMSATAEIILFPKIFKQIEQLLEQHNVFIIKGSLDFMSTTRCKIKADAFIPVTHLFERAGLITEVQCTLPHTLDDDWLAQAKQLIPPGSTPLSLVFTERGHQFTLQTKQHISCSLEVCQQLEKQGMTVQLLV